MPGTVTKRYRCLLPGRRVRRICWTFLLCLEGLRPVLAIFPTGAKSNRWKITVKVVFA